MRLALCFEEDARVWLSLRAGYDLKMAAQDSAIEREVIPRESAAA